MLKANELRIGNLILKGDIICSVIGLRDNIVFAQGIKNGNIFYREKSFDFQPITLTEEWLLNFGFQTSEWDNNSSLRKEVNSRITMVFYKEHKTFDIGDWELGVIQYIHQLQNLFFALTGEELQQAQ
jgi:hypothetical protein